MNTHDAYAAAAGFELRNPSASRLLLLLHGLGGDRNQPLSLAEQLTVPDLAVLAPDARAHGTTDLIGSSDDFCFDSMAADLISLLTATGQFGKPTYVAGISMGAALALRVARENDLDTRGAAFIRPAFTDVPSPSNLSIMARIADLLETLGPDAGLEEFIASDAFAAINAVSPANAESLYQQFIKPRAVARISRLRHIPQNTAYSRGDNLIDIRAPSIVLGTDRDPVHPMAIAEAWARRIVGSVFHVLPPKDQEGGAAEMQSRRLVQAHLAECLA